MITNHSRVVNLLSSSSTPMTINEISETLQIPKGTLMRVLADLENQGKITYRQARRTGRGSEPRLYRTMADA